MNGYELSRAWFDFSFENPDKIKPIHTAIYFFAIEHCNRLGWKKKFGFPTSMVLEATGVKSYASYKKHFDEIVQYGFFKVHEYSRNQYSSNIIELSLNVKANVKALDKALSTHGAKHCQRTGQSTSSIDKQYNNITIETIKQDNNGDKTKRFTPPSIEEVRAYCLERANKVNPEQWIDHYTSNGWMVGKNKMKDWKAAIRTWEKNNLNTTGNGTGSNNKSNQARITRQGIVDKYD